MDLPELNTWLDGFLYQEHHPDKHNHNLQIMQLLCDYFDNPEKSCPCFHVAGSKGKGTIVTNIAAIFQEAGYKTGAYMSPHVSHFTERIGTGTNIFKKTTYDAAFRQLKLGIDDLISKKQIQKTELTWFMLVTLFAMLCFRIEKVDVAIYEVGMGGRLDTTNIITPVCCCFGPIEIEHTQYLGNTLSQIATEKAGIIKPGIPIISTPQPAEVKQVLSTTANSMNSPIEFINNSYSYYVCQDAEVAKLAAKKYLPNISTKLMDRALEKVTLPGRFEIIKNIPSYPNIPYLLIDVAHTPNSIKQVLNRIRSEHLSGNLLFGCTADKDIKKITEFIKSCPSIKNIYLTRPGDFKKSDLTKICNSFQQINRNYTAANPDFTHFIPEVLSICNNTHTPLIILGSFYLAGEVKKCYNRYVS